MTIGEASRRSRVTAKMIRHYEALKLIRPAARTAAAYRVYDESNVHTLRFIRRARDLGFAIKEIQHLLSLWHNRRRASGDVRKIAGRHMADLDRRIRELQAMRSTLERLVQSCHGDERPDCPILEDLAATAAERG
jgi:Cu(I)-responsive transcriptional regulator